MLCIKAQASPAHAMTCAQTLRSLAAAAGNVAASAVLDSVVSGICIKRIVPAAAASSLVSAATGASVSSTRLIHECALLAVHELVLFFAVVKVHARTSPAWHAFATIF